jgi:hypothetical protein
MNNATLRGVFDGDLAENDAHTVYLRQLHLADTLFIGHLQPLRGCYGVRSSRSSRSTSSTSKMEQMNCTINLPGSAHVSGLSDDDS